MLLLFSFGLQNILRKTQTAEQPSHHRIWISSNTWACSLLKIIAQTMSCAETNTSVSALFCFWISPLDCCLLNHCTLTMVTVLVTVRVWESALSLFPPHFHYIFISFGVETECWYVAQTGLKLTMSLLILPEAGNISTYHNDNLIWP